MINQHQSRKKHFKTSFQEQSFNIMIFDTQLCQGIFNKFLKAVKFEDNIENVVGLVVLCVLTPTKLLSRKQQYYTHFFYKNHRFFGQSLVLSILIRLGIMVLIFAIFFSAGFLFFGKFESLYH